MAQVEVTVNGRVYKITCDNGQEGRLQQLAGYFDRHVVQLSRELGQIGDSRLMLLAALTVCDELFESRRRLADMERDSETPGVETVGGATRAIEEATDRVAALCHKVENA